jgi:iron(III) transport system ATP-binding protein
LCLRPEDVVVRGVTVADPNVLDATVGIMEFTGNHFATTLHVSGTQLSLSAEVSLNDARGFGIRPGGAIRIALPPDRLRVFVESKAA